MGVWVVQEQILQNGRVRSRSVIRKNREEVNRTLHNIAAEISGKGFILAEQNDECAVFERNGEKHAITAYEIEMPPAEPAISVKTYSIDENVLLEISRDKKTGKAYVFLYDRRRPEAKLGAGEMSISASDEEVIAVSAPSVRELLKAHYGGAEWQ